jgi:flagellar hook-length control protein FliK
VSSIASHVSATATIASSRQQQIAGSTPDSDKDPFAALLDAIAAAVDATNTQQASQQATATGKSAGDSVNSGTDSTGGLTLAANILSDNNSATASATPATAGDGAAVSTITQAAGTTETAGAKAASGKGATSVNSTQATKAKASLTASAKSKLEAALNAKSGANAAANATANTASDADAALSNGTDGTRHPAAASGGTDDAGATLARVKVSNAGKDAIPATATNAANDSTTAGNSDNNNTATAAVDDASAASQAQQPAVSAQPVAAAIAFNIPTDPAPATGSAAVEMTVGDSTTSRTKSAWLSAGERNAAAAQVTTDTGPETPAATANGADNAAPQAATAHEAAHDAARNSSAAQQNQPQADNSSTQVAANTTTAAAPAAQTTARADGFAVVTDSSTTSSSGVRTGSGDTKTEIAGLPNFGISAATASTSSAGTAAPAATAASGTVPIAGLAVAIAGRAHAGASQFDIRLDPPELGRIDVRLDVDRNGQVTSHITVDRPDTLQLLQNQQPQLQQALDQAGLKTADNGLQFMLRDQSFAGQNNGNNGGNAQPSVAQLVIPDADLPAVQSTQVYNRLGLGTGIDIRV